MKCVRLQYDLIVNIFGIFFFADSVKFQLERLAKMADAANLMIHQQAIIPNVCIILASQYFMKVSNFGRAAQNEPPILPHL